MRQPDSTSSPVTVEYRSTCEKFLFPAAFIALLGIVFSVANFFWETGYFHEYSLYGLAGFSAACLFFVLLMFGFNTSFEFDANARAVWFKLAVFKICRRIKIADFKEICGFAVSGIHNRARIHTWWSYRVVMLFKSGRKLAVSGTNDKSIHAVNRLAEKLAGIAGCFFFPGEGEKVMHAPVCGDQPIVEFRDWNFADSVAEFWADIFMSLLFFAAVLVFIVALTVSLN